MSQALAECLRRIKKEVCGITVTAYVKLFKGHETGKKSEYAVQNESERGFRGDSLVINAFVGAFHGPYTPLGALGGHKTQEIKITFSKAGLGN